MGLASQENQYLSGRAVLNCGDDTATEIDHEVMQLLHYSYEEAKRLLNEHREALDKIAGYLISRETITGKEFMKIFVRLRKDWRFRRIWMTFRMKYRRLPTGQQWKIQKG